MSRRNCSPRIPGARIVGVPGGGHLLNLTSPKEFDAAITAFLSNAAR